MSRIHVKENTKRIWIFVHIRMYAVLEVTDPRIYAIKGLKVTYSNFHIFLGMVQETSKNKKWSKGFKESAKGQGKAIQV